MGETDAEAKALMERYGSLCFCEGYMRQMIVYIEPRPSEPKTPKAAHLDLSFWFGFVPEVYKPEVKAIMTDVAAGFMERFQGQKADKRTRYNFIEELRERILRDVKPTKGWDRP